MDKSKAAYSAIEFRSSVLNALVADLEENPDVLAVWEAGSAANGTTDSYSDIDLVIMGSESVSAIYEKIEETLTRISKVNHKFVEPREFIPNFFQRIYFLEGAPKHFFADIGVFLKQSKNVSDELLQIERHGTPAIHFDKSGHVKPKKGDVQALEERQRKRLKEIEGAYPIFRTEVLKSLDRGHSIDAYAFFHMAIVRPIVELLGILYRPYRFDFGLRYVHKDFPEADKKAIERLLYVSTAEEMKGRMSEADEIFQSVRERVHEKLGE